MRVGLCGPPGWAGLGWVAVRESPLAVPGAAACVWSPPERRSARSAAADTAPWTRQHVEPEHAGASGPPIATRDASSRRASRPMDCPRPPPRHHRERSRDARRLVHQARRSTPRPYRRTPRGDRDGSRGTETARTRRRAIRSAGTRGTPPRRTAAGRHRLADERHGRRTFRDARARFHIGHRQTGRAACTQRSRGPCPSTPRNARQATPPSIGPPSFACRGRRRRFCILPWATDAQLLLARREPVSISPGLVVSERRSSDRADPPYIARAA